MAIRTLLSSGIISLRRNSSTDGEMNKSGIRSSNAAVIFQNDPRKNFACPSFGLAGRYTPSVRTCSGPSMHWIWRHSCTRVYTRACCRTLSNPVKYQVRAVELDINFLVRSIFPIGPQTRPILALQLFLKSLARCARGGRLGAITLNARDKFGTGPEGGDYLGYQALKKILHLRRAGEPAQRWNMPNSTAGEMLYHEYFEVLRRAGGRDGYLSHVKRKIVIDTLLQCCSEGVPTCRVLMAVNGDPNEMLDEISAAWGGGLIINREISHQDGNRILSAFDMGCTHGQYHFLYRYDLEVYIAAKCHASCGGYDKRPYREVLREFNTHSLGLDLIARYRDAKAFQAVTNCMI